MADRGILFSAPMVKAILMDRKSVTRRIAKGPPRWVVGDRLWVRETHWQRKDLVPSTKDPNAIVYMEEPMDDERRALHRKVPGIHMPRWASRITRDVVGVRTEPLHDMSDGDALLEGSCVRHEFDENHESRLDCFKAAWAAINGPGSWDENPDVHVINFRKVP